MANATSPYPHDTYELLKKMLRPDEYSDLTICCGDEKFKVHKSIVCPRSPVLKAACDGHFEEAHSNVINVDQFDGDTVARMLLFLYTDTYFNAAQEGWQREVPDDTTHNPKDDQAPDDRESDPDPIPKFDVVAANTDQGGESGTAGDTSENDGAIDEAASDNVLESVLCHVRMNAIADYYDILELRRAANVRIQEALDTSFSAHIFPMVVQEVFHCTGDKELHTLLSNWMAEHLEELLELKEAIAPPEILSDFAMNVVTRIARAQKGTEESLRQQVTKLEVNLNVKKSETYQREAELSYRLGQITQMEAKRESILGSIDEFKELLRRTVSCRNVKCDAQFRCYMEQVGPSFDPAWILRCSRCHCRHRTT